ECPRNVVIQEAFKEGTQPGNICPLHSPQQPPPAVDQFGVPIALDTTGTVMTDTATPAPMTSAARHGDATSDRAAAVDKHERAADLDDGIDAAATADNDYVPALKSPGAP